MAPLSIVFVSMVLVFKWAKNNKMVLPRKIIKLAMCTRVGISFNSNPFPTFFDLFNV